MKSTSISIRVSDEELNLFKEASKIESYASYSEFVRRTALKEAKRIINESKGIENNNESKSN